MSKIWKNKFWYGIGLLVLVCVTVGARFYQNEQKVTFDTNIEVTGKLTVNGQNVLGDASGDSTIVFGALNVGSDVYVGGNDIRLGSGAMISNTGDTLWFQDASENIGLIFTNNTVTAKTTSGVTTFSVGALDFGATGGTFSGRITGTDISVSDSIIGVTGDFSGKVTSASRITGADISISDSIIGVTGTFSGILRAGSTLYVTAAAALVDSGASTLRGTVTVGAGAGTITDVGGTMTLTEDTVVTSGVTNITGVLNALSSAWVNGTVAFGDAVVCSTTTALIGTATFGAGAGTIADVAGTMTITEDTVAVSGALLINGDVITTITEYTDSCGVVINGTTYFMFKTGVK